MIFEESLCGIPLFYFIFLPFSQSFINLCYKINNHIYNIWIKRQFSGAERGGIKFHGAIDTHIYNNRINNASRGMWLDWMTQGTRITGNLFYDNVVEDLYMEVNHGPYIVDNNIFGSPFNLWDMSDGGAFVHNLFFGKIRLTFYCFSV